MNSLKEKTRFDARMTKEQKQLFEKAALLAGFKNLSDFVIITVQEKALQIVSERETIISTQKDSEIFFNALVNHNKPNSALQQAIGKYQDSGGLK
ncbi:MAG: DUF1778 domain-containing protein [Bacteroidetes bacterium]|nr:DUF1778 domain-containing protein [Bacteroidota bacterium]